MRPMSGLADHTVTRFADHLATPLVWREIPSRHVTVILNAGDPLILADRGDRATLGSFATGLQTGPAHVERHGHQCGVHLRLSPPAAYALFGLPMHLLTGEVVDAADLMGRGADRLAERVAAAGGADQTLAVLRAEVNGRDSARRPSAVIVHAWRRLVATRGQVRIDDLVRGSGWSHRHFDTVFREQIGLLPKAAARLLRFEYAAALLRTSCLPLAELAVETAYFDQAHLNREFRVFAGCSPAVYRRAAGIEA